ncbi:High-affinity choline uptake protein BetT [Thioalkalivibrio nitratireducens DSM 14787]|uniref:High-affinity choline uptake protein BetT n=1 Tax=Thioalkalivibrio nitratireducens (strain DSM 14787 / UNIQEM 213 / ALEN2) TaxID=1255043 RepID=L0E0P3_THIND|nr:BCCT family transporter [Thioalkalivibrio nitratireducens]AGA35384.1 High-affinity choline uptake protein BetT [Thioalkalivibrio nitratireducens DSM 14787]
MNDDKIETKVEEIAQRYETDYEIGQQNINPLGLDLHNPVFVVSSLLILVFVVGSLIFPEQANEALGATRVWIGDTFDWLFLSAGNLFVLFCLALIVLPVGSIRIGGADATPDYSVLSWFAMLFAAGMGIGLMFWSVAEPVAYFTEWFGTPLNIEGGTEEAKAAALGATMYHWGLHPWAIYAVVGLSLAFFAYNKGLPLTIRSTFYPLLGDRVWGPFGHVIDTLAVLATMFGLATSLGLGAQQAAGGLEFLFGIDGGLNTQIAIIVVVTVIALISVIRGIDGGVKVLSNINLSMALLLLIFVMIAGAFVAFLSNIGTTVSAYAQYMLPLSNPVGREDDTFYHGWTIFFWAWWISWSPFVGMFIARISRGRTVRQFVTAVLLVPTVVTIIWMSAFGGSGIDQASAGIGALADGISDSSLALFQMLENLPFTAITSFLAIVLVLIFFVTSSDSGSLVIDSITSGGKTDSPQSQRIFWATIEGLVAGVLLAVGGVAALQALQAGAVSTGLPFVVVLLLMCVSLAIGLHHERILLKFAPDKAA